MNSTVWTYTPTEKSKQFREICNKLDEEWEKIYNDMVMKIENIKKRYKKNTIIKPLDNNLCIISDVKKLENDNNDLSISNINNASTSSVEINNDIENIDDLNISEVSFNEQSELDEIYDLFDKYSNDDFMNSDISEVELDWDEEFLFDHSSVEQQVSCVAIDVTDQPSETMLSRDISPTSYSNSDLKMTILLQPQYVKSESLGDAICIETALAEQFKCEKRFLRTLWDPGTISEDVDIPLL